MSRRRHVEWYADAISDQLRAFGFARLNTEQRECLLDPAQLDDALGMLDDLEARCGVTYWVDELRAYLTDPSLHKE
jgi:hypothetical protein